MDIIYSATCPKRKLDRTETLYLAENFHSLEILT
jgi:hypothetical protein